MVHLFKAVTLGLLIGLLGLIVSLIPFGFGIEENFGLDVLFKLRGTRQAPSNVIVVSIDKASATHLNLPNDPEKWPRSLHAHLTENLANAGATVIAFDIIFDEARSAADDQAFAGAIQQARNVVLFEYLKRETVPLIDKGGSAAGDLHIERLVPPMPLLTRSAAALAPFPLPKVPIKVNQYWTFKTGAGETPTMPVVVLQILTLEVYDEFIRLLEKVRPSLAAQLPRDKEAVLTTGVKKFVRLMRGMFKDDPLTAESLLEELQKVRARSVKTYQLLKALIRMYQSPDSQYLNFYGPPGTITTLPYYRVLQLQEASMADQKRLDLHGAAVFVGFSEHLRPTEKDGFYTVFSQASGVDISGVEIAATAFANLLDDTPVRPFSSGWHLATVFLWGMLLGTLCCLMPTLIAAGSMLGLGALYLVAAQYQFTATGSWSPLIVPVFMQMPLAFFSAVLWKYVETNKERQNIREAFAYYLPEQIIDQLSKRVANVKTSRQLVYGTCLFTDVEQYTSLAETLEPEELGVLMNAYYETVFEPVRQHGGIVSDVIGDAMLAIWATAQPEATLRDQACLAALEIASAVQRFKQSSDTLQLPTRIGLHSGRMLLGNIGALDHYEYRAVGDIVNTASRVQGLNKYLGTQTLVSKEVLYQLDGFLTRELGTFLFAGKSQPLVVHELLCRVEGSNKQLKSLCAIFAEALDAYQSRRWEEAIEKFHEILSSNSSKEDGPSLFYVKLCEQYCERPPEESWKGVVRMVKK